MVAGTVLEKEDFFRNCRKSLNVAILENSRLVKSTTYVSEKTLFKVFRQSLLKSSKNDFAPKADMISGNPQITAWKSFCSELAIGRIVGVLR